MWMKIRNKYLSTCCIDTQNVVLLAQNVVLLAQNVVLLAQNVVLLPHSSLMWCGSRRSPNSYKQVQTVQAFICCGNFCTCG